MSCPACGTAMSAGLERCPGCGATVAPPVEGALAPDPAARPLREIPGLKKRERTWKDEVRDRVRDRKRARGEELPLFRDAGEAEEPEATEPTVREPPLELAPPRVEPALRERRLGGPQPAAAVSALIELGDEADLPLHPAPTGAVAVVPAPDLRLAGVEPEPNRAAPRAPERSADDEWTLGGEPAEASRPVERPAYSGERARAAAVDLALLAPLWAVVVYFASRAAHVGLLGLRPAWMYLVGYLAFLGLIYAGYFTGTTGQTLGKIAMGLRVVDASGRPPGYLRAFARAALGSLGVLLAGTGLVPMFLDPARRALHDRLLRTRVIKG